MQKLFIEDLDLKGKKVLLRADFNVPLDNDLNVADATRIDATLPSIRYVLKNGGSLILMSHLGRPRGAHQPELSLKPVAQVLKDLLELPVQMAPGCVDKRTQEMAASIQPGQILLLENLRFNRAEEHPEEDPNFAKTLASYGDVYINDAFGTSHREHSSTYTITQYFPGKAAAGFLLEKEIHFLGEALHSPKRPFHAVIGGAKISTKIGVLKSLLQKVDRLLIGGGMAYTFLKAKGISIGDSLVEKDFFPLASALLQDYREKILLPLDCIIAKECSEDAPTQIADMNGKGIPEGYQGLDIGPKTIELFSQTLSQANTILWNGPLGVYELKNFSKGTHNIALTLAGSSAITIAGGGDLIRAINRAGVADKLTHISTGGGATLEYIEFGSLPGIEALSPRLV